MDAGISGIRADKRLQAAGRDIRKACGVIVSHDHSDHVRCAGIYQRKFGLPLHLTSKTLDASAGQLGKLDDVRCFDAGDMLEFGPLAVETVPTRHDAVDGVAFIIRHKKKRLGILTDLGHVFDGLHEVIHSLDAVFIESNYDPTMLENGPYPYYLQERIRGPGGHISNGESADLLSEAAHGRLQWACLAHLSENNNRPSVALKTHRRMANGTYTLHAAEYRKASRVFEV